MREASQMAFPANLESARGGVRRLELRFQPVSVWAITVLLAVGALLPASAPGADVKLNGASYVSLREVAGFFGMKRQWVAANEKIALSSQWTRMEFTVHKRDMELNDTKVYLGGPVARMNNDLYIQRLDFERTLKPVLTPQKFAPAPRLRSIVIDAGHGGKDPGTQNKSLKIREKELVIDITKRLKRLLEAKGYSVSLTRDRDIFIGLEERARIANRRKADLFVSVHLNAFTAPQVKGSETYAFTPQYQPSTRASKVTAGARKKYPANNFDAWNTLLGYYVQSELIDDLRSSDRGLKRARWEVLKTLNCPGILVEAGFVTNPQEGRQLQTSAYRQKIAQAVADGISRYDKTITRLRGRN